MAFAANSVLGRMALADASIDALSFTAIRLISAGIFLGVLLTFKSRRTPSSFSFIGVFMEKNWRHWLGALALFTYALSFSFAYKYIDAGVGALVLFGAVQITLFALNVFSGGRISGLEWLGAGVAFAGVLVLTPLGSNAVLAQGFMLMAISGMAWGAYTAMGARAISPLMATASNFIRTVPFMILVWVAFIAQAHMSAKGVVLATLSGVIASAVGYAVWYKVLPLLSRSFAAVSQLTVPIMAAIGGTLFMGEVFSLRLCVAMVLVGVGVSIVTFAKPAAGPNALKPNRGSPNQ